MAPYRAGRDDRARAAAAPEGLVSDMVRQFADPYAFLRELVQNAIDSGASRVGVRCERTLGGSVTTAVTDDGGGMTREIIEGPLLTLFASSKEGDPSAIGRYGVGFVSVFAIEPELVEIETWRDGSAWRVRLRRDHSYELADDGAREGSGTRVTLLGRMDEQEFAAHGERARAALLRWCRHAGCPIELSIDDASAIDRAPSPSARIDVPFAVRGAVQIVVREGEEVFALGCSAGAAPPANAHEALEQGPRFAGFYRRGLTLFETAEEAFAGLEGLYFKVSSPRIAHTMSRDNVRRDGELERVLGRVRALSKGALRQAAAEMVETEALRVAGGGPSDGLVAALDAAREAPLSMAAVELALPLAHPLRGARVHRHASRKAVLVAARADALTAALSRDGRAVLLARDGALRSRLDRIFASGGGTLTAHDAFSLVLGCDVEPGPDLELCLATRRALVAGGRSRVRGVTLARIEGAYGRNAAVSTRATPPAEGFLVAVAASAASLERVVCLNVRQPLVRLARAAARERPGAAAMLLARGLLVEAGGAMAESQSDALLALAEELGP